MASWIVAMSTDDIGFEDEMRRADEMDMRLPLDIDEWDDRADATEEEGEIDRGVEMSGFEVLEVLYADDAIACVGDSWGEKKKRRRKRRRGWSSASWATL